MPLAVIYASAPDSTCQHWPASTKDVIDWLKSQFSTSIQRFEGVSVDDIVDSHWQTIASAAFQWAEDPNQNVISAGRLKFFPESDPNVATLQLDGFTGSIGIFVIADRTH